MKKPKTSKTAKRQAKQIPKVSIRGRGKCIRISGEGS